MNKIKLVSASVLTVIGFAAVSQPVAATTLSSATSIPDIQFRQKGKDDENNNSLIEPENPTREDSIFPSNTTEDKRGTNRGPLVIDYVSDFHFGEQIMSGNNVTYYAKPATVFNSAEDAKNQQNGITVPNYIQVTDDRGTSAGWTLKVAQTEDFTVDGKEVAPETDDGSALRGTVLKIKNLNSFKRSSNGAALPDTFATDNAVSLSKGTAEQLFAGAKEGQGTGSIAILAGSVKNDPETASKSISLDVPGSIKKQKGVLYKAELTWNLEDTPS
ncbi:WxL domain-containing protein [Vagococcus sp. JNUCC 83]